MTRPLDVRRKKSASCLKWTRTLLGPVLAALVGAFAGPAAAQFCPPESNPPCRDDSCKCSATNVTALDPVHIHYASTVGRFVDVTLQDSVTPLKFLRTYVPAGPYLVHARLSETLPKPFGAGPVSLNSMPWWHNWFSFVAVTGFGSTDTWQLLDMGGTSETFASCGLADCVALPNHSATIGNADQLAYTGIPSTRFILQRGDRRVVYDKVWVAPLGDSFSYYFFPSSIESTIQPVPAEVTLVTISYSLPPNCAGSPDGTPYIGTITGEDGSSLVFTYARLTRIPRPSECVLRSVAMQGPTGNPTKVASFTYESIMGVETPGRLASVTYPESGKQDNYVYVADNSGNTVAFATVENGLSLMRHDYDSNGTVVDAGTPNIAALVQSSPSAGICHTSSAVIPPLGTCFSDLGQVPSVRATQDLNAGFGDGTTPTGSPFLLTSYATTFFDWSPRVGDVRLYEKIDSCTTGTASLCNSMSPGTIRYEWLFGDSTTRNAAMPRAVKDKKDYWTTYFYQTGAAIPYVELARTTMGATDIDGGSALQYEDRTYLYMNNNNRMAGQYSAQTSKPSVLAPTGTIDPNARVTYSYDLQQHNLKAQVRSGWTETYNPSSNTWSVGTARSYIGSFYFPLRSCGTPSGPDPLFRTLEVHGPCWVTSDTAADCSGTLYPVTQYIYYDNTLSTPNRGRLQTVRRWPNLTSQCAAGTNLDTTYDNYDIRGNPGTISDANGVPTAYAYEEDRITRRQVGSTSITGTCGATADLTCFSYDNGKLASIRYAKGNGETFCYHRAATPGGSCPAGGTDFSDKLQWKARIDSAGNWQEMVKFVYWPDGSVMREDSVIPGSPIEIRRVKQYAQDAHHRLTYERWGDMAGSYKASYGFDANDNRSLVGLGYNFPPSFCIDASTGNPSLACAQISYDGLNRVATVDEFPVYGQTPGTRTCMQYDAQGNVAKVQGGCPTNAPCGSCTQPVSTYVTDDFGNVVEVQHASAYSGTIHSEYDAMGNVVRKQTPQMATTTDRVEYTYDMLGRNLTAVHRSNSTNELLYQFTYDVSQPPSGCSVPQYQMSRLAQRTDNFGDTWYSYDNAGRLVQEMRVRANASCGSGYYNNPTTSYFYNENGELTQINYPYGRTIWYTYPVAYQDRVSGVDSNVYDGTVWSRRQALAGAVWEPYGGLRGYQLNHTTASQWSSVEYMLGDDGSAPLGCPTTPSAVSSDHTGRFRAIFISSGQVVPGTGVGDIYRRRYAWTADQVAQIDTCFNGSTNPITEFYGYGFDQLLRLVQAQGTEFTTGGVISTKTWNYDARSNVTYRGEDAYDVFNLTYYASPLVDRLMAKTERPDFGILQSSYLYDNDGRVTQRSSENYPGTAIPAWSASFAYGTVFQSGNDSVFKAATVSTGGAAATYNYYLNAVGRRRAKVYPTGIIDEYFDDSANRLLSDQGNDRLQTPVTWYPIDDYVYLGDRLVAVVRGKFATDWTRQSDFSSDCQRSGNAASCDVYFPVQDRVGRTLVILDSSRRISNAFDWDPFGYPNRVSVDKETLHPYLSSSDVNLADFTQATIPGLNVKIRVKYDFVDTVAYPGCMPDATWLRDGPSGPALTQTYQGVQQGTFWTPWVQPTSGHAIVWFHSLCQAMGPTCACTEATRTGVVVSAYEYQRYQSGVTKPFSLPLRFAGQYFDEETDLAENWNRYYDPSIGRYLQPEPSLKNPNYVVSIAKGGRSVAAYAYAFNNPINFTDPDGLGGPALPCLPGDSTVVCCLKQNPGEFERCGADPEDCVNKCVVKGTTTYAICLSKGVQPYICETSAMKSIAGCIKNCPFQCSGGPPGGGPPGPPDPGPRF